MVAVRQIVTNRPKLTVEYDSAVDVLHILLGRAVPFEGAGRPRGVELDYSLDSGEPVGATVIGFRRNGWKADQKELASMLSRHLRLEPADIVRAIQRKTEER